MSYLNLLIAEKEAYQRFYEDIKYDKKITQCYKNAIEDKILILQVKIWGLKKQYDKSK